MPLKSEHTRLAVILSVALHALVFALAVNHLFGKPDAPKVEEKIVYMQVVPPQPEKPIPEPVIPLPTLAPASSPTSTPPAARSMQAPQDKLAAAVTDHQPTSMTAPAAPTAEEWAFAAKYTLKNSKGYRYNWGQQVRSMMGTAVEGPDQGMVRFRLEIAPDGKLAKLETLWSTSPVAEQLARKVIANMPPLPPTPTGKPLVFEKNNRIYALCSGRAARVQERLPARRAGFSQPVCVGRQVAPCPSRGSVSRKTQPRGL